MFSLFLFSGLLAPLALADFFPMCLPGWDWANNTLQQNPCEVTSLLEAQCGGYSVYGLGPLGQGDMYLPPQKNDSFGQKCDCNTVIFRYDVSPYA